MAQERDNASWELRAWAGTIEQLARAIRLCEVEIAKVRPYPEGFDPSDVYANADIRGQHHEAERAREVHIVLYEKEGFSRAFSDVEDLQALPQEDFDQIVLIKATIGQWEGSLPVSAMLKVSREGLETRLSGDDRTWTAGLQHRLQKELRPRQRLRPPLFIHPAVGLVWGFLAFAVVTLSLNTYFDSVANWSSGTRLLAAEALGVCAALPFYLTSFFTPSFELLTPGQKPKYQRYRSKVIGAWAAVGLSILASVLVAPAL